MSGPRDDDKIAPTAHYTAYAWHHLGLPHAEAFATPFGAVMFHAFRPVSERASRLGAHVPTMTQYLAARHLAIDAALEGLAPDRVVELGAGLSRRGVTFAARGVRYVEVDLPAMTAEKVRRLHAAGPALRSLAAGRLEHVAADVLADAFPAVIDALLAGAERPAVVAEGLLGYFARADRARLARTVADALGGRGVFLTELRHAGEGAAANAAVSTLKAAIRVVTRGRGTREDFIDLADAQRFLRDCGFAEARPVPLPSGLAHLRPPARVFEARGRVDRATP